jgi:hypothetical protein
VVEFWQSNLVARPWLLLCSKGDVAEGEKFPTPFKKMFRAAN